ncbi:hypothetical protein HNQ59_000385 [Chitinivorax tropicus]|uniref:Lipoprotein n=1 Tax=Chitinivorax tropicus TaxID=714531 RepID=A0A840MLP8_9PROT|nr:hypothetical protein [Chitinivorax tropicus]MBB5017123.1 hypothetical protein [Chitinivorax tropicus]
MLNSIRLIIVLSLATIMMGCSHRIVITPAAGTVKATSPNDKINRTVAYVMTEAQRSKQVTTAAGGGDKVSYFPYRDLEASLSSVLSDVFSKVQAASSIAEANKIGGIDLILTPTISTHSSSKSMFTWPPTDFTVTISSVMTDSEGNQIWQNVAQGAGHASFSEFKSDFPLSAKRASADAMNKLRHALLEAKELAGERSQVIPPHKADNSPPMRAKSRKFGEWSYVAEQYAASQDCHGAAWLIGQEGVQQMYEVDCRSGRRLMVQCMNGSCKEKKT